MYKQIKNIMNELVLLGATPGINYKVTVNNTSYAGSLGLKSKYDIIDGKLILKEEQNNINTLYDIASLTKVICTVPIIFRLYEKGKLNLDDKVSKYLKDFKYDDISIYDLLTHTSGLPADLKSKEIVSRDEIIKKVYSIDKENPKGTFLYSDVGYILLGLVIENICLKPLDEVFKEEVTIPLNMKNTCFNPKNIDLVAPTEVTEKRGVVRAVVHDEKACSMNGVCGCAGVFSTVDDICNFTTMILNNGIYNGKKYLNKDTIDNWFKPTINDRIYKRSYSWFVGDNPNVIENEGNDIISFNGFTGPSISIDRKNKLSIIMMTNRVHPTRDNKLNSNYRSYITKEIYKETNLDKRNGDSMIELNYDDVKNSFDNYIEECKKKIKNTFFNEDELVGLKSIKDNLVKSGKIDEKSSLEEAIKFERLQMIDVKINHTMRVVEDAISIANKIGTSIDFNKVLKVSALLHDIGRFDQATWNNSFSEACYKNVDGINNHAEAGYNILFVNNKIKDFPINKKFYTAIGTVVRDHQISVLEGDLAIKLKNVKQLNVNKLTGLSELNADEKVIVAVLIQMVKDVDMLDILYQHLTGEFPVIRPDVNYKIMGESLSQIANYWGISENDLLEYNGITNNDLDKLETIKVPVSKINLNKLDVSMDIKNRFFQNENIDLKELMNRRDWTFITGMWWRLNHFLNNINFTSNLEVVKEKELLDKIYNQYPEEYKFLVRDAFEFAQLKLIENKIKNNYGNIYVENQKIM